MYLVSPPVYGMYWRVLPGTLAPRYHELQLGCTWIGPANRLMRSAHSSCAPASASMLRLFVERRCWMQAVIHSTWCSIEVTMLVRTEGLPGPVTVNRFGKPATPNPR